MKIGLFGGSFDPVHYGHILPVREASKQLELERVIFLPTAVPPHKPGRQFAPARARFVMVELALLEEKGFFASPLEMTEDRPAYTIESVEHFDRLFPDSELHLILGADNFVELTEWKRWRDIPKLARLAILVRPEWRMEEMRETLPSELKELADSDRLSFVCNQPVEISSTEVRELLGSRSQIDKGIVPSLVLEYIRKYSLYR